MVRPRSDLRSDGGLSRRLRPLVRRQQAPAGMRRASLFMLRRRVVRFSARSSLAVASHKKADVLCHVLLRKAPRVAHLRFLSLKRIHIHPHVRRLHPFLCGWWVLRRGGRQIQVNRPRSCQQTLVLLAMRAVLGNNQKTMGFDYLQSARKLGSWADPGRSFGLGCLLDLRAASPMSATSPSDQPLSVPGRK